MAEAAPTEQQPAQREPDDRAALKTQKGLLVFGRAVAWIAYVWVIFVDVVLVIRVFLLAFGANPHASFARWIYTTSADMLAPFRGLFPPKTVNATGYLDVSALFAILIYTLLVFFIGWLVDAMGYKLREVRRRLGE